MKKLEAVGLVEADEGSYYYITDKGRAYLSGELDADGLRIDAE